MSSLLNLCPLSTVQIRTKAAARRHFMINGIGRREKIAMLGKQRPLFMHSAMMGDGSTSSSVTDMRQLTTTFTPSMWGDIFSLFSSDDQLQQRYSEEIEELKREVSSLLTAATSTKLMILIDKLERFGLAFHFDTEIEEKLKQVYDSINEQDEDHNLFSTALRFRLLRQHRYCVSCDEFQKFTDKDKKLKEGLSSDVEGLLSLYEAAHVRIHDENVLEEAVAFTSKHLSRMLPQLKSPLREEVQQALEYPLHKSHIILTLRTYIDIHEKHESREDKLLLRLAKLNFNFMQNIFRNEIVELTKWWNKFDLRSKVPSYFRERIVENYMVVMAAHFEPDYFLYRTIMTKLAILTTVMDDTYDNYATPDEIELLTRALQRWNIDEIEELPDYLKTIYEFVMSFTEELEVEATKHGKAYVVPYFIEAMKHVGRGFEKEQKWVTGQHDRPSFEEYVVHSRIVSLIYVMVIASVAVIESGTRETIDLVLSDYEIFTLGFEIARLYGDLASHQRESKEGRMFTCIDYYMKDKGVSSKEEAEAAVKEVIEDKWKLQNAAWVNSTSIVPKEIGGSVVDIARISAIYYSKQVDGLTNPEKDLAPRIIALLLDPILV